MGAVLSARCVVRWRSLAGFDSHDIARFGLVIEMQLDMASLQLQQHALDAALD